MRFRDRVLRVFGLDRTPPQEGPAVFQHYDMEAPELYIRPPPPPAIFPLAMPPPVGNSANPVNAGNPFEHDRAGPADQQQAAAPAAAQNPAAVGSPNRNPDNPDVPLNFPNPDGFTREEIKLINSRFRQFFTTILILQLGFNAIISASIGASGFYIDSCLGQTVLLFLFGLIIMGYPTVAAMRHKSYFKNVASKVGLTYVLFSIISFIINMTSLGLGYFSRFSTINPIQCICTSDTTSVPKIERHPILDTFSAIICLLVTALPLTIRPILELFDKFMSKENEAIQNRRDAARIQGMSDEIHRMRREDIIHQQRIEGLNDELTRARQRADTSAQLADRLRREIADHPQMPATGVAQLLAYDGQCPYSCQYQAVQAAAPRTSPRQSARSILLPPLPTPILPELPPLPDFNPYAQDEQIESARDTRRRERRERRAGAARV